MSLSVFFFIEDNIFFELFAVEAPQIFRELKSDHLSKTLRTSLSLFTHTFNHSGEKARSVPFQPSHGRDVGDALL